MQNFPILRGFGASPRFLVSTSPQYFTHFHVAQKAFSRITPPRPGKTYLDFTSLSDVDGDIVGVHVDVGQPLLKIAFALLLLHDERRQGGIVAAILGDGVGATAPDVHGHPVEGVVLQGPRSHAGSHVVVHAHGLPLLHLARLLRAALDELAGIWKKNHTTIFWGDDFAARCGLGDSTSITVTEDGQPAPPISTIVKLGFIPGGSIHLKLRLEHLG